MRTRIDSVMGVLSVMAALTATVAWAEPLSVQDRDAITRLGSAQGRSENEIAPLLDHVNKVGERGLPTESLLNKVREGLAKGVEPKRIDPVLRQMTSRLESAHEVLQEAGSRGMEEGNRQRAIETMAEAFSRGATVDEVRELSRLSQDGRHKATQEELAAGAKSLAVMKEGRVPSKDGAALVGEGMKQGYRSSELLDLSREVKRRGSDFEEGRASLKAIREQVSRGERSDRLFKDEGHSGSGGGDRGDRGDRGGRDRREDSSRERSERQDRDRSGGGDRSDRIERPERVDRPERPEKSDRIERPERLERSERSGSGRDH
ncbi:MAG: hypothetical protein OEV01_04050 [Nitrospira sp.]|nr:hypothetical protein [Nitrospira sp.]MDH4303058.1 hypothetical protein [Nitrospira sp.]MDH5192647.1 hypothetical protein [Nitrospira sp.]